MTNRYVLGSVLIVIGLLIAWRYITKIPPAERTWRNSGYLAILLGVATGASIRAIAAFEFEIFKLMSLAFLFFGPFVIGFINIFFLAEERPLTAGKAIVCRTSPVLLCTGLVSIIGIEGAICLFMALPIWLIMSSIGGLMAYGIRKLGFKSRKAPCFAFVFPILLGGVESSVPIPNEVLEASNDMVIEANLEEVWELVREVKPIKPNELSLSLASLMGFPQPDSAILVGSGVDAYRLARFHGGVEFHEAITVWKPFEAIHFTIKANTDRIPATTLDEHVTIGGPYFDMLTGHYDLKALPDGRTLVKLSSRHRLNTHFNWYAGVWSKAIMSSIQSNILLVIKNRAEAA